ncbi:putative inactive leucine-rich repeat receptor-like protein kinase At3g03770 isoform X1 [Primulina tabacum]|uniref:putative inactive leucine-rich repeat receptor-like protein kinase At3g03770 isoform X1 n=1 Tax=Primulina tabacum TaxID=48773 RepID=UPI003F5A57F1
MAHNAEWRNVGQNALPVLLLLLISVIHTEQLESSQIRALLKVQQILGFPPFLNSWNKATDFCNSEPSSDLTIVCYEENITQLHIVGETGAPRLPENFSIDSFVATLAKIPGLKVLRLVSLGLWGPFPGEFTNLSSLELLNLTSNFFQGSMSPSISSMTRLQSLILDSNNLIGGMPDGIGSLSSLVVLSARNNSLNGSLPHLLGNLGDLRVLALSNNKFSGDVPDLGGLTNLQVLDLENNFLGPRFPEVCDNIESIVLRNNKFTFGIPDIVRSYYQLKIFIISSNRFVGPFPVSLLSLPRLTYLDIAQNKFTGMLIENLPCSDELSFVNLTDNLLTGKLPSSLLSGSRKRVVLYAENCLSTGDQNQNPISLCTNEALAVGILPNSQKRKQASKVILALGISGGVIGAAILAWATFLVARNFLDESQKQKSPPRLVSENVSAVYTSKLLKDARYITQAMKVGALGVPSYRTFSLEELKEGTKNFDTSTSMGEGSHGQTQMYRGRLRDGSNVAIRCLKLKKNHSTQYLMHHIEMISKLRHHHLVSALGHCFEYHLDDSSVSRVILVFEYVPNGTLRTWISDKRVSRKLTWAQRIAAATGVAKGIQFLHTGIMPGVFSNNLKITDVLLDQNLVAKISSYNLPLLAENTEKDHLQNFLGSKEARNARAKHQNKLDIYDFGVMLLEIISGEPINSRSEVEFLKDRFQASTTMDDTSRNSIVDRAIRNLCSGESMKTMMELCCRCLIKDPADRPSIEDVLWNLQFASQVQDAWRGDSQSSDSFSNFASQICRLKAQYQIID